MDCRGCRYYRNLADNHCIGCNGDGYTRPSNADRIRAKSDEELAKWFTISVIPRVCEIPLKAGNEPMFDQWLDWLRSEAEEEDRL